MRTRDEGAPLRGLIAVTLVGAALGVAYNSVGLHMTGTWGLAWVAAPDPEDVMLDEPPGTDGLAESGYVSDDPMAIPAAAASSVDLPEIPDLGRPIQMQLPIVKRFFDEDAALFIDARDREDFSAGHIPGALNLPFDEVVTDPVRLAEVDSGGRPIVTYCSGGTCESSTNLAWELIQNGHSRVVVFQGGWPAWEEAGFPIAASDQPVETVAAGGSLARFAGAALALALVVLGLTGRGRLGKGLGSILRAPLVVWLASLGIGAVLGVAGMAKIGDPAAFAEQIGNFHMMPAEAHNLLAVALPWIELMAALALILGIRRRSGGIVAALLMALFSVAVAQAALRGFDVECGCFGTADSSRVGLGKLAENLGLLALALVATVRRG